MVQIAKKIPTKIPVQRLQIGNCFPLIKNDLSGRQWHPKKNRQPFSKKFYHSIPHFFI